MTEYLVQDVGAIREFRWERSKQIQNAFRLTLAGIDEPIELRQPRDRDWPQAGDRVFGELRKDWNGRFLAKTRKKGSK